MSILVAMGLIPLFGWKVQMVTVVLPVILLAVANDYAIHLIARFQEENTGQAGSSAEITKRVVAELGVPVFAAGATTAAGMLCLLTHLVVPARQLGILAGIGVMFAIAASLTYGPAVMSKLPLPKPIPGLGTERAGGPLDRLLHRLAHGVVRRPIAVIVACVLFVAAASAGIPALKVDTNPVNYYPEGAPVAVTAQAINEHFGGSTEISVMVGGDIQDPAVLKKLDALETELRGMAQVGYTMSIARVVRKMNQAVSGGDPAQDRIPDSREAVAQLFLLYGMGGSPEDFERMVDFDYRHALLTARVSSMSTEDIAAVVDDIEAYTARELGGLDVTIGGFGEVFADLVDAVVDGQVSSLALSFAVVAAMCALAFFSIEAGVYSMIPLALAIPSLFGLMGHMGIELNVVTAMLSSIMIGVGVDYTIHFLWRYREERAQFSPEDAAFRALTTSGRGIVFNALSVVFGFSILLLSNFLPVRFFGFLVVVSIGGCLVGAMMLMPAVVVTLRPRFAERRVRPAAQERLRA
jgi:hydrophobe/amphiphile efflux-3 (HAE3) family protein